MGIRYVLKSMKVSKMINALSDQQKQAIAEQLGGEGAFVGVFGQKEPEEAIRLAVAMVSSSGGDPEAFIRTLILEVDDLP